MCGITGIIGKYFDHEMLTIMMDRIAHRGPDNKGKWSNGLVSFGHLRLSIIDLSASADQPMHCPVSGNVIILNGEIYNYKELKEELKGFYRFQTESDTEVLLAAYLKWGVDCLKNLRGMFAFALYDARKKKVLLVRDRLGIKPLYYRTTQGWLLFSSEIKGLINLSGLSHSVNDNKVVEFLSFRHLDTDDTTFFKEVQQVPAGSFSWVSLEGELHGFEKWWKVPISGSRIFVNSDSEDFKGQLTESIRIHLRSDVPLGSFLSGGLDSSSIACLAYQLLGTNSKLSTFSSILTEKTEENALIPLLQNHIPNAHHNSIELNGSNFIEELPTIIYHHDEPVPDASMYAHYQLCKLASQKGIKVLLSGSGGDEVLGGYAAHIYSLLGRSLKLHQYKKLIASTNKYATTRHESRMLLYLRAIQETIPFVVRKALKRKIAIRKARKFLKVTNTPTIDFYPVNNVDPWQANYENNLSAWTVPPFLHYEDRNSMAFGVEIRVPMLDHIFLEYLATFAPESLVSGRTKNILRESLSGLVPQAVLDQKGKFGFPAPIEVYTRYNATAFIRSYLENIQGVPFVNPIAAEKAGLNFINNNRTDLLNDVWRIYSMSVWYHQFFK